MVVHWTMTSNDPVQCTAKSQGISRHESGLVCTKYLCFSCSESAPESLIFAWWSFYARLSQSTPHSSWVRPSYGIPSVNSRSDICMGCGCATWIDQNHKSHNAPVPYPTMHHFVTEMCTCVHFLLQNGALWDIYPMHCGMCEMFYWYGIFGQNVWSVNCIQTF